VTRHIVGTVDDIPEGQRAIVQIDGREIGVFNVGGRYFAILNRCPHEAGPLCRGQLVGALNSAAPGDYRVDSDTTILRCPWHQWEFDVTTGQSWCDPERMRVRTYETAIASGRDLQSNPNGDSATGGPAGMVPGPYVAETYPVSVEKRYVVVDLARRRVSTPAPEAVGESTTNERIEQHD
jgi:3-phenylpropionate/trans-cinnamate dioxygenase ferredoxin subunit